MKKVIIYMFLVGILLVLTGCESDSSSIMMIGGSGGGSGNTTIINNNFTNNITNNITIVNNFTNNYQSGINNLFSLTNGYLWVQNSSNSNISINLTGFDARYLQSFTEVDPKALIDNTTQANLINAGFTNDSTIFTRQSADNSTLTGFIVNLGTMNSTILARESANNNTQASLINAGFTNDSTIFTREASNNLTQANLISSLFNANTTTNGRIDGINATQRADNSTLAGLINLRALPGICGAGTFVQNTTTGGVQCATPPAGTGGFTNGSDITVGSINITNLIYAVNITLRPNCADGQILKWLNGVGQCGADNSGSFSGKINLTQINTTNVGVSGQILSYGSSGDQGTWVADQTGSGSSVIINRTKANQNINTTSVSAWRMIPNFSMALASATTYQITCEFLTSSNLTTSGSQNNISYLGFGHNISQKCWDHPTATTLFSNENNFTNSVVNTFSCLSTGNIANNVIKTTYYKAVIQTNASTYLNWSIKCETGVCNVWSAPLSFCKAEVI